EWKRNAEETAKNRDEWKQNSEKWENEAKECEKHRKETESKINEIITSHLSINITEIENLSTIEKLDTILNTIKQEVKEYLKLLKMPFQTGDSLMSMLKKLVKACEEVGIETGVQENLLRSLKILDPETKIDDPKSFNGNPGYGSMDDLVKACYEKGWVKDSDPEFIGKEFESHPELSFVRKLMRCHYYMVGKSNPFSVKTMAENLLAITNPNQEKLWKCLKILTPEISDFNPEYNYIDDLVKACYDHGPTAKNDPNYKDKGYKHKPDIKFIKKLNRCYFYLINENHELKSVETKIDDLITIAKPNQEKLWKCLKSLEPEISDFNPEYDYIDDLVKSISGQADHIQKIINELNTENKTLKYENKELKKNNSVLKTFKEENEKLKTQVNDKNNDNTTLKQQLENCNKDLKNIELQTEKCLTALGSKYNKDTTLDQNMNKLVELCEELTIF
ncbi:8286_t:CDS:2, partial [Racocetra fulgida]